MKVIRLDAYRRLKLKVEHGLITKDDMRQALKYQSSLINHLIDQGKNDAKQRQDDTSSTKSASFPKAEKLESQALLGIIPAFDCPKKMLENFWEIVESDLEKQTLTIRITEHSVFEGVAEHEF